MSETDDTDVLLIIPPNFFGISNSDLEDSILESSRTVIQKPVSCTAQVLGRLVDQVNSLETRLEELEIDTCHNTTAKSRRCLSWNNTTCDSLKDRKYFTFPRHRRRKVKKSNINTPSLNNSLIEFGSTLSKISCQYKAQNSLEYFINETKSMDDISSIVSTPTKKNDKLLLHEVDEFLKKVETYETPECKFIETEVGPDNIIKATGDYFTQKLNPNSDVHLPSGKTIPSSILYLAKNSQGHSPNTQSSDFRYDNIDNVKSPIIRKLNFTENKDVQPTSTPKQNLQSSYNNSFRPSSHKIYEKASRVLEHYRSQSSSQVDQNTLTDVDVKKEVFKVPQMRPYVDSHESLKIAAMQVDSIDTELLSLSDLWGDKGEKGDRVDSIKLEEERLKREHCEAMIQQLQKKVLDQQEKLAVAIKVDKAKDEAISKLKGSWLRLTNSLGKAEERHKVALDKMLREVDKFKNLADDSQKKTNHFEKELYKALDLAHDYQEKCKVHIIEKNRLQEDVSKSLASKDNIIETKQKEIETLKDNYDTIMRLNKQSADYVKSLENMINKVKEEHEDTKQKLNEMQNKMHCNSEAKQLAEQERDILKEKVNEERSRCNILERQLCDSQTQYSDLLQKYDSQENELKTLRKHLELQKSELKCHYQQQLEDAVISKLQEFQKQLDIAQKDMEETAQTREAGLIDNYNKQVSRMEEQHKLEVNVLEEKQREEIKLYRLQLAQASEKIGLLENKVESFKKRRGEIASQLHAVMRAQWTQALRILTRPHLPAHGAQHYAQRSPLDYPTHSEQHVRSHTASHSRYHQHDDSPHDAVGTPGLQDYRLPASVPLGGATRDDLTTSFEELGESEMQRYIRVLLSKKPNLETPEQSIDVKDLSEEPTSDRPDRPERRDKVRRSLNSKPPWKA